MAETIATSDKRLLIAVPDPHLRAILRNFFVRAYTVTLAESAQQTIVELESSPVDFDAILIDMAMPPSGLDIAARVRKTFPHIPIGLLVASEYEHHFVSLNKYDIFTVIVRTAPLDFDELQVAVENMIYPAKAFGLRRYLRAPAEVHEKVILSLTDKQAMMEEALEFFRRFRPHDTDVSQIRLAVEELINNAIYHAFRRATGDEKYKLGAFDHLDRGEQIFVEFGCDKRYLACSVTDNQGTLDVPTVMKKLERQITQEGILDERGRGLYLTRTLSDKMIINIHPTVRTQIILLFAHRKNSKIKPFYLHHVPLI